MKKPNKTPSYRYISRHSKVNRGKKKSGVVFFSELSYWIGELLICLAILLILYYYVYLTYWTNYQSHIQRNNINTAYNNKLDKPDSITVIDGDKDDDSQKEDTLPKNVLGIFEAPSIDIKSPILEGISLRTLNRGVVGHYADSALPGEVGNLILAGHRNGHGEIFRRLNNINVGDIITIKTRNKIYKYKMEYFIPKISPDVSWPLDAIPNYKDFNKPGKYITLITCTPEFTSLYRMLWLGKLVESNG